MGAYDLRGTLLGGPFKGVLIYLVGYKRGIPTLGNVDPQVVGPQ